MRRARSGLRLTSFLSGLELVRKGVIVQRDGHDVRGDIDGKTTNGVDGLSQVGGLCPSDCCQMWKDQLTAHWRGGSDCEN